MAGRDGATIANAVARMEQTAEGAQRTLTLLLAQNERVESDPVWVDQLAVRRTAVQAVALLTGEQPDQVQARIVEAAGKLL